MKGKKNGGTGTFRITIPHPFNRKIIEVMGEGRSTKLLLHTKVFGLMLVLSGDKLYKLAGAIARRMGDNHARSKTGKVGKVGKIAKITKPVKPGKKGGGGLKLRRPKA